MAYRDSTVTRTANGSAFPTANATYPTLAANDTLLCWFVQDTQQAVSTPSGWTLEGSQVQTGPDGQSGYLFSKVATGSESGTFTISTSVGQRCIAIVASWSGRDTSTPVRFATGTQNTSGNSSAISVGLSGGTAVAGDDLAWFAQLDQATTAGATWGFTAPSGYTERQDDSNGDWITSTLATQDNVSAGATGTVTGTATQLTGAADTAGWSGFVVAIKAAASTAGNIAWIRA